MRRLKLALPAACLVALVSITIAAWHLHHDRDVWTPDSAIYLRMALQDRGVPADPARAFTNRFIREKLSGKSAGESSDRGLFSDHPPQYYVDQFALFANRPLYPLLSALLFPAFGPRSLNIVCAVAYFSSVMTMFALLTSMTSIVRASVGALVFGTEQVVLNFAALPLTDELALFLWTCVLAAMIAYQRKPRTPALAIIGLASIALTLTRPAFFLPVGAAAGAYDFMRRSFRTTTAIAPLAAVSPAVLVYFGYTAAVHGPNALAQLHWQYAEQLSIHGVGTQHGPIFWYAYALLVDLYSIVVSAVAELGGIIVVLFAVLGSRVPSDGAVRVAIFSAAAISLAVFVNPLGGERPILLPAAPLSVLLAVVGFERLRKRDEAHNP